MTGPAPSCQREREDLIACLLRSDCVIKSGRTPQDCIRHRTELPLECQHLITSFTDCKKGMLDMRRRFRGNHLATKTDNRDAAALGVVPDVSADINEQR